MSKNIGVSRRWLHFAELTRHTMVGGGRWFHVFCRFPWSSLDQGGSELIGRIFR